MRHARAAATAAKSGACCWRIVHKGATRRKHATHSMRSGRAAS
jgi:hypothetical protein